MEKKFSQWTKDEIIEAFLGIYIPKISEAERTITTFNLGSDDAQAIAYTFEKGEYFVAPLDWDYFGSGKNLPWESTTLEALTAELTKELQGFSLNQVRERYQEHRYIHHKLEELDKWQARAFSAETKIKMAQVLLNIDIQQALNDYAKKIKDEKEAQQEEE